MRLISAGSLVRAQSGPPESRAGSSPGAETIFGFNDDYFVFLDHWHKFLLEFLLPKFAFVKLIFHRFAALQIRKSTHEEKRVVVFHRKKRPEDFDSDFPMLGHAPGLEDVEKFRAPSIGRFQVQACGGEPAGVLRPRLAGKKCVFPERKDQ
jgi:hypothetical protein